MLSHPKYCLHPDSSIYVYMFLEKKMITAFLWKSDVLWPHLWSFWHVSYDNLCIYVVPRDSGRNHGNSQSRQQTENAMTKTVNNCKTYNIESMRFFTSKLVFCQKRPFDLNSSLQNKQWTSSHIKIFCKFLDLFTAVNLVKLR